MTIRIYGTAPGGLQYKWRFSASDLNLVDKLAGFD